MSRLPLRRRLRLVVQHLDLAAQLRHLLAQALELLGKLQRGIRGGKAFEGVLDARELLR